MTVPLPAVGDTSWSDWGQFVHNRVTTTLDGKIDAEQARDTIAAALRAGANVTITTDDVADTITIAASGGGTTDPEVVRDTMATALVAGTNVTITVDDVANTITISATGGSGTPADATTTAKGIVQLAGHLGGTAAAPTVRTSSTTQTGVVELATTTETTTGTDTARAVTPAGVKAALDARPSGGLTAGVTLRAIWNGTAYVDRSDSTTITSATDRPAGTYFVFLGGPDPNALGLMVDGDEWKDAV